MGPRAWLAWAAVVVALPWLALWLWPRLDGQPLPNICIVLDLPEQPRSKKCVPRNAELEKFLQQLSGRWAQRRLPLQLGHHPWEPQLGRLGAELDVDAMAARVLRIGRGGPVSTLMDWYRSLVGRGHTLRWRPKLNHETFAKYEAYVKSHLEREPEPGLVFPDGRTVEGMQGERLDGAELWVAIKDALAGHAPVRVATRVTEPGPPRHLRTEAEMAALEGPPKRAWTHRYVTCYGAARPGRRTNIEQAAMRLHGGIGRVIPPGGEVRFNDIAGPRTLANGYDFATEVRNGQPVSGDQCPASNPCIGGGVCQVAGTLHALAFFAGLDITEHYPHTRLPRYRYLPPGLDAAVTWPAGRAEGGKDLVIRNPYPRPVMLEVARSGKRLEMKLHGEIAPYRVDCCYEVEDETDGAQRIRRWRTVYKPNGPERTSESKVYQDGVHGDPSSWHNDGARCWQRPDDRPGCGPCGV